MQVEYVDGVEVKVYAPKQPSKKKKAVAMADWKLKKAKARIQQQRAQQEASERKKQEQRIIKTYIRVAVQAIHGIEEIKLALDAMTKEQRQERLIEIGKRLVEENINKQ